MKYVTKGYVGKKGEIYIDKKSRKKAGIKPGDSLIVLVARGELRILKVPTLSDIMKKKPLATIDAEEIEAISLEMQKLYMGELDEGGY